MTGSAPSPEKDFFISYNSRDRPWAEWIAWILEEAEYKVVIQAWDFRPGGNFVLDMQRAARCQRTIAVLSQHYLDAEYTQPEWAAAYKQDPKSLERKLIPIRVGKCKPDGLLAAIVYVDLVGKAREEAKELILNALKERAKPETEPAFPGDSDASTEQLEVLPERAKPDSQPAFPGEVELASEATEVVGSEELTDPSGPLNLTNPFLPLTGGVEAAERFFNCDRTLDRVFELLNAGSSVALIGETGLGKSSILWAVHRLAESRLEAARVPVRLNLATVYSEADFYEDLCEGLGIEPQGNGNAVVRSLRKRRILLLLDEVERISQKDFPRRIREQLRGLAEGRNAPLRLVITARTSLDRLFSDSEVEGQTSPLEGICIEEWLDPWSEETSRQFIADHLFNGPVQFSDSDINRLLELSQGNPQKLMQYCHRLFNRYRDGSP